MGQTLSLEHLSPNPGIWVVAWWGQVTLIQCGLARGPQVLAGKGLCGEKRVLFVPLFILLLETQAGMLPKPQHLDCDETHTMGPRLVQPRQVGQW